MNKNRIEVYDIVDICWESINYENNLKVLYIPQYAGDSWQLQRNDGTVVNVMNYCKMVMVKKGDENG